MHVFLGGSFDPVHFGHLRIATELSELLNEPVHLMPCRAPVHKAATSVSVDARMEMLKLAIEGDNKLRVDTRELEAESDSYTIHSLEQMQKEGLGPVVMGIGTDSAASLATWKRAKEFSGLCHIAVLKRPQNKEQALSSKLRELGFELAHQTSELKTEKSGKVVFCSVSQLQIASSDIRRRIEQKMSIRYLVPDAVERFICDNGIYRP